MFKLLHEKFSDDYFSFNLLFCEKYNYYLKNRELDCSYRLRGESHFLLLKYIVILYLYNSILYIYVK